MIVTPRAADAVPVMPVHGRRRWRRATGVVVAVLLVLGLAGCAGVTDTLGALSSDGFSSPSVNINSDGTGTEVAVSSPHHATLSDDDAEARAAEIVWRQTPVRFDRVHIAVGQKDSVFSREQLTGVFGPRDPALDARSVGDEVLSTFAWIAVGFVVAALAAAILVVVLVRRSRRRRAESASQGPWGPPPYPGHPGAPGPYPPPGGPGPTAPR